MSEKAVLFGINLVFNLAFASLYIQLPADWKWTSLLIEAGFLCFLLSIKLRRYSHSSSTIVVWLLKWLLFREAVSTGFSRLSSDNYFWYDLSAMEHYFSMQISPTPPAYYLSLAPRWFIRIVSAAFIAMEIFLPFLFLIPVRELQMFSFFANFMFHANLMLTGNYGIYNLLSIVISLALLPEPKRKYKKSSAFQRFISITTTVAVLAVLFYGVWVFFDLSEGVEAMRIGTRIDSPAVSVLVRAFFVRYPNLCIRLGVSSPQATLVSDLCLLPARVPFSTLVDLSGSVPLPRFASELTAALKPFHLANDYRFFHQKEKDALLKVDRQRTTLVLEGAMNENGPWKELSFRHIPSIPEKMPSIIPGHLPVVDFEVAVSGERPFEKSPTIASLVYRILTNEKEAETSDGCQLRIVNAGQGSSDDGSTLESERLLCCPRNGLIGEQIFIVASFSILCVPMTAFSTLFAWMEE
ncbi:unnamed protein product [Hydatigera taeniaeformis]|uniref:Lipase maturation factor n=1 Tax=Hydatigena taeniaeformis TaxID=6205 RepID=A0A0R3X6A8_HYDTA|nr:unnamed protein product [Hydatigera taeniaeformis]